MKKLLLFLAAATMAVSCIINIGGGSAVWVGECTEEGIDHTEVREVGHFRAVASSLPANVYYVQADKQEVRVETTEELASKVQTTVEDGILSLKLEPGRYPKLILRVVVSSPDIEKLSVSGSGNLFQEGPLHASGALALKVSGSGDMVTGEIDSQDFTAQCSGSGSIRVGALACDDFGGKISGSGTITMGRISCDDFEMGVSGSRREHGPENRRLRRYLHQGFLPRRDRHHFRLRQHHRRPQVQPHQRQVFRFRRREPVGFLSP